MKRDNDQSGKKELIRQLKEARSEAKQAKAELKKANAKIEDLEFKARIAFSIKVGSFTLFNLQDSNIHSILLLLSSIISLLH